MQARSPTASLALLFFSFSLKKRIFAVYKGTREFWAYSAKQMNWFQESWWSWQKVRRKQPISWIFLSVCPFFFGMVSRRQTHGHTQESLPDSGEKLWADTMSSSMPKYLKMELNNNSSVILTVGRPLRGRSRQDLENRSKITSMHVLPSESGRSLMKSTPRCDHGRLGMGNGRSLPAGKWRGLL